MYLCTLKQLQTFVKFFKTFKCRLCRRYIIEDNRAIFMYKDGSQAFIAKDYLIEQERCESVSIDSKIYEGKHNKKVSI